MADYVVVGAGSAGCVLAARLSEDPGTSVTLVEAGPPDADPALHVPLAFPKLFRTALDWDYLSGPEPALDGRELYVPRGRVLGGSSSLNAMIYVRGNRLDYDEWAALGATGWSWTDVLPYFLRAEDNERGAGPLHAAGGPLGVSDSRSRSPLAQAWVEAAIATGLPANDDFNGPEQDGVGLYQLTQRGGMRCSSATAYLHPALGRRNLTLIPGALVTRVCFDGARASGVEILLEGASARLDAEREVILCAGAYNTPQLLLLSGIGPAEHLRAHGLDVRVDQPAVGANLQDHVNAGMIMRTSLESLMTAESAESLRLLRTQGRGPLTSNVAEAGGFTRTRSGLDAPDVQFHFAPVMFSGAGRASPSEHAWSVGACVLRPQARGELRLRSADPAAKPLIVSRYLDGEADWASMLAAHELLREIAAQPALARHGTDPYRAPRSAAEADVRAHIRAEAHCLYHPVGSCAIGRVLDPELRVEGVDGLRVADASAMPVIPRGNTNAAAIMIGEKAADLIRGRDPATLEDLARAAE